MKTTAEVKKFVVLTLTPEQTKALKNLLGEQPSGSVLDEVYAVLRRAQEGL